MRVLLVEDDKIVGDGVVQGLEMEGYAVDWVEDTDSAMAALRADGYELMVLDLGLPDGSGLDVLQNLRRRANDLPVLILTAYDATTYKLKGLDAGADDYLVKPFDLDELLARLRALRRRSHGRAAPTLRVGTVELDPHSKTVTLDGQPVNIAPREFSVLHILMENAGKVLSRNQLEDRLYGWGNEIESNAVEVHIHGLRKKLGKDFVKTIRNLGYKVGGS